MNRFIMLLLTMLVASTAATETLIISASNIRAGEGDVRVGIFNSADEFPDGEWSKGLAVAGDEETLRIEIAELTPGRYSAVVYQDLNGNLKIDKNFLGIPKEPYGLAEAGKVAEHHSKTPISNYRPVGQKYQSG